MKPWFAKEADIIKFPEPEKKVLDMPNVASYPDFITGVSDLKALAKQIQKLPPDTDPAILSKINDYIKMATDKTQTQDPEANIYTRISRKVKNIDDSDMQKYYKMVCGWNTSCNSF